MGINAELIELVADLRQTGRLEGHSVMEFGAQVVCCLPDVVDRVIAARFPADAGSGGAVPSAAQLYARLGLDAYASIDASGEHGALALDLNSDLLTSGFARQFDLVTNLGTLEHCFNQHAAFKNMHDLCQPGGMMIHALTSTGNVNHGFYNYHPRFVADLAAANGYEMARLGFTVDYRPEWYPYSLEAFRRFDSHDVMIYAALRRTSAAGFATPFDGMFAQMNQVAGYAAGGANPQETQFAPYLKTGDWANVRGDAPAAPAASPTASPSTTPSPPGAPRAAWRRFLGL